MTRQVGFKVETAIETPEGQKGRFVDRTFAPASRPVLRAALLSDAKNRRGRKARAKLRRIYARYFGKGK